MLVLLAAGASWLATGANRGWTKTSVTIKTLDPVTGLRASLTRKNFCPALIFSARLLSSRAYWRELHFFSETKNKNQNNNNKNMKLNHLIPLLSLATAAYAAPQPFDFKDPKGVNNAVFKLDAPLESVNGSASGITGTVTFDPENPGATTGKIIVASESLTVPIRCRRNICTATNGSTWRSILKSHLNRSRSQM